MDRWLVGGGLRMVVARSCNTLVERMTVVVAVVMPSNVLPLVLIKVASITIPVIIEAWGS